MTCLSADRAGAALAGVDAIDDPTSITITAASDHLIRAIDTPSFLLYVTKLAADARPTEKLAVKLTDRRAP
jgi:hypothetical protein